MTIAYVDPLTRAWNRMTRILFKPFELVKWLVLGFSAWLASLTDGGGGSGWSRISSDRLPSRHRIVQDAEELVDRILEHALLIPLVLLAVLLVVAIILVLLWLSSRGKFIFLDNLINDRAAIVEPWRRFVRLGNSLFLWRLGFGLACFAAVMVILLLMAGPALGFAWTDGLRGLSLVAVVFGGILLFALAVAVAYISLFLEAFVVPIMYKYRLTATEAWRYFLPWLSRHGAHFLVYGLFVLLLWILFAIAFSAFCLLTCCIVLLPYVGTVMLLPVIVTYRLFSIEFLAQLDPGFDLYEPVPVTADAESGPMVRDSALE